MGERWNICSRIPGKFEIRAHAVPWQDTVALLISHYSPGLPATRSVATNLQLETVEEGAEIEPTLVLQVREAQQLMDELWRCGLRPQASHGSAGQLKATERHLQDMRTAAFNLLDRVLGGIEPVKIKEGEYGSKIDSDLLEV